VFVVYGGSEDVLNYARVTTYKHARVRLYSTCVGVCDTEYAHNTALKIGTALVNYYVPLTIMAVLYSRIFVAIRRRSKLEIWQNAIIVAGVGGGRSTPREMSSAAGTPRSLLDDKREDEDEEPNADADSCRSRCQDDGNEASLLQQSPVVDRTWSQNSPECEAQSNRLYADDVDSAPSSTFEEERQSSPVDVRRKCVRFLLVQQRESRCSDVDLDQIEMWTVQQRGGECEIAGAERSDGGEPRTRLMRRLRHRIPRRRRQRRGSPRQNSLTSDVKAAKQLGVIMGAFCVCFLPYFVCFVVVAVCRHCVDDQLMTTVTWIGYINSTLNPFLYPLCNQQFRISFRRMFTNARLFAAAIKGSTASST